jgi:hypothetical protein
MVFLLGCLTRDYTSLVREREEFVPLVKKANGFVHDYWLDNGNGEGAMIDGLSHC